MKTQVKEKKMMAIEEAELMSPQQLFEQSKKGELVVGCNFTPAEQSKIDKLAGQIDIHDRLGLLSYGSDAQDKLTNYSNGRLSQYDTAKLGETGQALVQVVTDLKTYNPDLENEPNGLVKWFKRKKQNAEEALVAAKASFDTVCANIDKTEKFLIEKHYKPLTAEMKDFKEMYALLSATYRELSMYIAAGQQSLNYAKEVELPELDRKAQETQSQLDAQILRNAAEDINSFESNLFCLETTREQCMFQMAFVRKLDGIYFETAKQLQDFVANTIPTWRNQMRLNLGMQDALNAQHSLEVVRKFSNDLYLSSAEQLRKLNAQTAEHMNKPIISIETSVKVNETVKGMLEDDINILNKNMQEVHEGREILRKIEDDRNETLRNYAIKVAQIAVQHAYTPSDPYNNSGEPLTGDYYKVVEARPGETVISNGMREATGDEPKKYTLD